MFDQICYIKYWNTLRTLKFMLEMNRNGFIVTSLLLTVDTFTYKTAAKVEQALCWWQDTFTTLIRGFGFKKCPTFSADAVVFRAFSGRHITCFSVEELILCYNDITWFHIQNVCCCGKLTLHSTLNTLSLELNLVMAVSFCENYFIHRAQESESDLIWILIKLNTGLSWKKTCLTLRKNLDWGRGSPFIIMERPWKCRQS